MSEQLYSIKESTLTDIGDALRRRHGETEIIYKDIETKISKSPNATGFNTFEGNYGTSKTEIITISGASTIKVKVAYDIGKGAMAPDSLRIAAGAHTSVNPSDAILSVNSTSGMRELEIAGDTVTFYLLSSSGGRELLGYYAECVGFGDVEVPNTYKSSEMAQAIDDIDTGVVLPEEAFVVTGPCSYRFANGGWDWFVESAKDKITTKDIRDAEYMFHNSKLEEIPFEINMANVSSNAYHKIEWMFRNCDRLKSIPKINNCRPYNLTYLFYGCYRLKNIPDDIGDWFDWSYLENVTSSYTGGVSNMFQNCYSLRAVPMGFLNNGNPSLATSYVYFNNGFYYCYSLDELVGLPIPYIATYTANMFNNTFGRCSRLKNVTFATPDGQPYIMNWKSQVIDLTANCGWGSSIADVTNYNSGITTDKRVTDDATYQALKNDPDWFTTDIAYSRYNHDSAVATINSLPDTSAYLATTSGTNTIKFKKASGSATDGGAIENLTEEEIAVAIAKGWTVTLV